MLKNNCNESGPSTGMPSVSAATCCVLDQIVENPST
jgi:hypothetical protein